MNKKVTPILYVLKTECGTFSKIGRTRKDPLNRLEQVQGGCPIKLSLAFYEESAKASEIESEMIKRFNSNRTSGEWFKLSSAEFESFICEIKTLLGGKNVS